MNCYISVKHLEKFFCVQKRIKVGNGIVEQLPPPGAQDQTEILFSQPYFAYA
jgi:hypothetical protein